MKLTENEKWLKDPENRRLYNQEHIKISLQEELYRIAIEAINPVLEKRYGLKSQRMDELIYNHPTTLTAKAIKKVIDKFPKEHRDDVGKFLHAERAKLADKWLMEHLEVSYNTLMQYMNGDNYFTSISDWANLFTKLGYRIDIKAMKGCL